MSSNEQSRIDRLEALAEKILEGLSETKQKTDSNAKSIQALTDAITADREELKQFKREWRQDRRQIFEWMSRLAAAQADFYEAQADHYNLLEKIEEKQTQMQSQILDILAQITRKDEH